MAPPRDEVFNLAYLDQLTAGLACSDPAAVHDSRRLLAETVAAATPNLLRWLLEAIAAKMEEPGV